MRQDLASDPSARADSKRWLNRTVIGAGLTSACGDLAYETTNVLLPGFLEVLGIPAAVLGTVEGIADATASFTKLAAGHIADRLGVRKPLVVLGYALTPVGQALIALAWGWPLILCGRVLSWFGKGIRGPLRDAIVAESITEQTRGRAFGFHRAMDTVGAVVGPLLGVALLSRAQTWGWTHPASAFRLVFWCTLIPGVLSVLCFALLVRDDRSEPNPKLRFWTSLRQLPTGFRKYLFAVAFFGIGDFSHSLLILGATQLLKPEFGVIRATQIAGILYVVRNTVQTLASYPIGAAADRFGRLLVLRCGYALGAITAILTAVAFMHQWHGYLSLGTVFVTAGLYVAVQESLEPSITADLVQAESRGVAYGALGSLNGTGKLVSSTAVGFLWTAVSAEVAFSFAALLMSVGTLLLWRLRITGSLKSD